MTDLEKIREQIDETDRELVRLFEQRMKLAEAVGTTKIRSGRAVFDPVREREKLRAVADLASGDFNKAGVQTMFEQLMALSRMRQYQLLTENGVTLPTDYAQTDRLQFHQARVVFQGVEGAYSYEAMNTFFDDTIERVHVRTWREAMQMVTEGRADFGVLPIENSTAGIVSDIYDLLLQFRIYIVGEQIIPIEHMLMAVPGTRLEEISVVSSHPQALAQCAAYLSRHPEWKLVESLNTAIAAEKVASAGSHRHAAIASRAAASYYGLEILQEGGMSEEKNATRFIVISANRCFVRTSNKISICIELPHACGSLYHMLSHFIFNGLNLVKIESRPIPEQPFEYRFFIDFEGNPGDPAVRNALRGIEAEAGGVRLLGCY